MTFFAKTLSILLTTAAFSASFAQGKPDSWILDENGAIIRGDLAHKELALVFVGDRLTDGLNHIVTTLKANETRASFFLTGNFYTEPVNQPIIKQLTEEGHYLGAHSDKHLLYVDLENKDSLLVTMDEFKHDLNSNYKHMAHVGIKKADALFFIPPYQAYNSHISNWTNQLGLHLVGFSPGTLTHLDNTNPDHPNYKSSEEIYQSIIQHEITHQHGLRGFILLMHVGTDPQRTDKFYLKLEALLNHLEHKGYSFVEIHELLE